MTVEDHKICSGFGSIITEILCEEGINVKFQRSSIKITKIMILTNVL